MKKVSILCVVFCVMLVISSLSFGASAKEAETISVGEAPVYYIETYEQLKNLAYTAQSDCRYILNDNIYQEDNLNDIEIVIPTGAYFNLDLNGYTIQRSTMGNDCALFRIKSDATMIINDTSEPQTGSCVFSEGYSNYRKAVFYNEGGELEIIGGYYEIVSPYEQGDCSVVRTTSGLTYIHDGTFDSSASWGGDSISVGHNAYMYDVPRVIIFGGDFYGKYQSIDVTPFDNYLNYGCLFPSVYVLGGNFYVTNGGKDGEDASFAYCNNSWGRVIVAEGIVLSKCLNARDQMFLPGVSKKLFSETIDDYTGGYYEVTAPPMIMSDGLDYYYRLINLCQKEEVRSYKGYSTVEQYYGEEFEYILGSFDTINVSENDKESPAMELVNRTTDHKYIRWYMCDEASFSGADTQWTHLGDFDDVSHVQLDERPEEGGDYLIRCVVTDSSLSTYEDIVRIAYAPLKETETVTSVEVNDVKIPVAGDTPDFNLTPADDSFYINEVYWTDRTNSGYPVTMKETDVFEAGHTYELEVWIRANEYYKFQTDSDGWIDISATICEKNAEVVLPGSEISAILRIEFVIENTEVISTSTAPAETSASTQPTSGEDIHTDPAETSQSTEPAKPTEPASGDEQPTTSTDPSEGTTATNPSEPSEGTTITNPSEPSVDKGILGDVNGDGKVNIKDATQIQKYAAKLVELTDAEFIRADVTADNKVNIKDATAIQKYVAKIETGFAIGQPIQ